MTDPDADESKIERLEKRIAELEKRQSRSALSRRSILAGVLGVGGLAAMGNVSAQQNQVGTIGTQNKRVDLLADDVDANTAILNGKTLNGHSRIFSKTFSGGTLSESISLTGDRRSQYIIFDGISPGGLTQITATFDNDTGASYFYNLEDRGGIGTTTTGDSKIKLCDNLGSDGGFGGRYQIVESRGARVSLIGEGVVTNASEQKLTSGGFGGTGRRNSIQLNSNGSLAAGKIEVWEEIV